MDLRLQLEAKSLSMKFKYFLKKKFNTLYGDLKFYIK